MGFITLILAIALIAGGGHVAGFLTFAIVKTNIVSAGAGKAILAAIPKILVWAKVWIGLERLDNVARHYQRYKIKKAYEKWIKKLVFKSDKGDSAREILNSKIWRSYIVEEADDPMVSFGDLTDEWFTEHALFGEIGSVSQRYGILGDMVDADQTTA